MRSANMGDANMLPLADALRLNKVISTLVLNNLQLQSTFFESLGNAIISNPHCALNYIGIYTIKIVCLIVDFGNNNVGSKGGAALAKAFECLGPLVHLNLSSCSIDSASLAAILKVEK